MSELVRWDLLPNGVAVVTVDNPPVNAISPGVPEGIQAAFNRAKSEPEVRAVVLIGAGRTFIAGVDINQLASAADPPKLHGLLAEMELCPKPIVAAIHGTALGGGLEIAMAAHYRVATQDAQMGQPEVNLGIIPGAEGTQRLPRLVGVAKALEMCISGAPLKGAEALQAGLIDRVVPAGLLDGAAEFALEMAASGGPYPRTSERIEKLPAADENDYQRARELAQKIRRNQTAPLAVVEAIKAAANFPFEEGCRKEGQLFDQCLASDQATAMIHAFLGEREVAKIPGIAKDAAIPTFSRVAIVGAGTMGSGIAMAFANAGIPVHLKDSDQAAIDQATAAIRKNYDLSVKRGRFSPQQVQERMALIHTQLNYDGFDRADVIIEAVFENMALKKRIFGALDEIAGPDCLFASNTSSLDIDEIAQATSRAERVIGLHFFCPANVMRLLEIVRGRAASMETISKALAIAKKLKKVGVVVGNSPGFVGTRIFLPYMREAQFLTEEGATPWHVDQVLYDWGMAMGIFAVDDMAGIDIGWKVREANKSRQKQSVRVPLLLDKLYAMERFGQKTGRGWYLYGKDRARAADLEVEAMIAETAAAAGIPRRTITDEEIIERCIYVMVNEGARILEEGIALRANDIDIVFLTGYGFPAYRGGPMWYADTVGLQNVYRRIVEFHRVHGELWEPAPLLKRLAEEGETFASFDKNKMRNLASGVRTPA